MADGETACVSLFFVFFFHCVQYFKIPVCPSLSKSFLRYSLHLDTASCTVCVGTLTPTCLCKMLIMLLLPALQGHCVTSLKRFYFDFSSKRMRCTYLRGNGLMEMTVNTCTCNELP